MKYSIKFLKVGGIILGLCCLVVGVSFAKAWLSDRQSTSKNDDGLNATYSDVYNNVTANPTSVVVEETTGINPDKTTKPVDTPTVEPSNTAGNSVIQTPDPQSSLLTPQVSVKPAEIDLDMKPLCQKVMADFCKRSLEPLGFILSSEEYSTSTQNLVLLRFDQKDNVGYDVKKHAATLLGLFVFQEFDDMTGYKTDYLKVHLRLPEGDSFSLERDDYKKWRSLNVSKDLLFDEYMNNIFEKDQKDDKVSKVFNALDLQQYLNNVMKDGMTYQVEGEAKPDPGIYIYVDKSKKEMDTAQIEETTIKLAKEVFVNYYQKTNQLVGAFKFIDKTKDTMTVLYRNEMETYWPEGSDDGRLREYIKKQMSISNCH